MYAHCMLLLNDTHGISVQVDLTAARKLRQEFFGEGLMRGMGGVVAGAWGMRMSEAFYYSISKSIKLHHFSLLLQVVLNGLQLILI